jgi:hypothetical protein
MMSVISVAYWRAWKGVKPEDVLAQARNSRAFLAKHGVRYELNFVRVGAEAGQWEVITTFSDWESYGNIINNEERLALLAQAANLGELTGSRLVTTISL